MSWGGEHGVRISLSAVVMAVRGGRLSVLTTEDANGDLALPSGPFDPVHDRTFERALRAFVTDQTGFGLGFVEQLYTFGDAGRGAPRATPGPDQQREISVGYLALTADAVDVAPPGARWTPVLEVFPWEDRRQAGTPEDVFLAVQRQVVLVLGHQHLGQQARGRDALVDDVRRHGGLHQGLALGADPLAADVALDREDAGHVIQLLGHVLPDALQLAAAAAGSVLGLVVVLGARQIGRQRDALGLLLVDRDLARRTLLDLQGQRCQVGVDGLLNEALLLGVERLGLGRELQPLEHRHLVGELVDGGLLEGDLGALAGHVCHQRANRISQLVRAERVEVGDHGS
jgi:ADP-ribose pyrophosphatase YjhB (NUDIX family)